MRRNINRFERPLSLADKLIYVAAVSLILTFAILSIVTFV